jgi:hypothetical protein
VGYATIFFNVADKNLFWGRIHAHSHTDRFAVTANVSRVLSNIHNGFCKLKASNGTPPNLMLDGTGNCWAEFALLV